MRCRLSVLFLTSVLWLAAGVARADNRSTFRVVGAELNGGEVQLNVAWHHNGEPEKVEFYAHKKAPGHRSEAVREGLLLKKFEMKEGPGTGKLKADLGALKEKLGLAPGEKLCVVATWPGISSAGHHWGTNMGGRWTEGTSVTIPAAKRNSSLRRGRAIPLRLTWRCTGPKTSGPPALLRGGIGAKPLRRGASPRLGGRRPAGRRLVGRRLVGRRLGRRR